MLARFQFHVEAGLQTRLGLRSAADAQGGQGDPPTFAAVLGLLATVAVIACAIPATRAARLDPMLVLRDQ